MPRQTRLDLHMDIRAQARFSSGFVQQTNLVKIVKNRLKPMRDNIVQTFIRDKTERKNFSLRQNSSNMDGFLDRGVVRLVEFNVDSPGGAAFVDGMADGFRELPIFRAFTRDFHVWRRPSVPAIRRATEMPSSAVQRSS